MQSLYDKLKSNPIVYVTRDIERALGISPDTEGYFIISNNTNFGNTIAKGRKNILLLPNDTEKNEMNSTAQLLKNSETKNFIDSIPNASILVFKNTTQIEKICAENNWRLLNPPAEVSNKIEEKISQVKVFAPLQDLFLHFQIKKCKDINWTGTQFVLQFNYSHTGSGTVLIDSEEKLNDIKHKFSEREARIADFIDGPIFTNNNVLASDNLLMGNISYQITGLAEFTNTTFATIGNDWGLPNKLLASDQITNYKLIVKSVSELLQKLGWRGLFGVDVIMDSKTKKMYLLEVNARQPASTTFESLLQKKTNSDGINIFQAHLAVLLGIELSTDKIIPILNGAQIIKRIKKENELSDNLSQIINTLKKDGFNIMEYANKNIGAELLRIQSDNSLMENHNVLNDWGEKIVKAICPSKQTLSPSAQKVVEAYKNLKIGNNFVNVPYFNNDRIKTRGGLKVFTGKGNIEEINEEILILSKKNQINLSSLSKDEAKKFLVDNNIGIDCSGFVYYVLEAELKNRQNLSLRKAIKFPTKKILRKLIAKLRRVQNTNVLTLADDANSHSISLQEARPGDLIVMLKTGIKKDHNHMMIITETTSTEKISNNKKESVLTGLSYAHSYKWSLDGKYNHGVRSGQIEVTNAETDLLAQTWIEQMKTGDNNETYTNAKGACTISIRRLNGLI